MRPLRCGGRRGTMTEEEGETRPVRRRKPSHEPIGVRPAYPEHHKGTVEAFNWGRPPLEDWDPAPSGDGRVMRATTNGTLYFTGPCPRCHIRGTVYARTRTRDYRCSYCKIVLAVEDLEVDVQEIVDEAGEVQRACYRIVGAVSEGDRAGAVAALQEANEGVLRLGDLVELYGFTAPKRESRKRPRRSKDDTRKRHPP